MNTVSEQPEAGRDLAAHIHEYAPADDFARWHYVPEIQDAATWLRALRPQPQEANAEAVRLLRKVWHYRTGYGTDVCEMLAENDYDDLCAEVETFLAQHGGRGDE